jgi:hypothetical protein
VTTVAAPVVVTVQFRDLPDPIALVPAIGVCETCGKLEPGLVDPATGVHSCTWCAFEAVAVGAITRIVSVTR